MIEIREKDAISIQQVSEIWFVVTPEAKLTEIRRLKNSLDHFIAITLVFTAKTVYSEYLNTEQPKSKLRQNPNRREFGFQTSFWSFKPNATSSD